MWYAIFTKPGREESVAFQLEHIGIEVLKPKLKSLKYRNHKFIEVVEPLFPCYLFANFDKDRYSHLIAYTRGVRHIVGKNHPITVPEEVIDTIKEGIGEDDILSVRPRKFSRGERIFIREGPFRDFYGIFEREINGSDRVMILLGALNYRIELDSCFLAVA